jgi:hypothetical protein
MSTSDPQPALSGLVPTRRVISYESAAPFGPRRWWVYAVLGIYLLFVATLLTAPFWIARSGDLSLGIIAGAVIAVLMICGLAMMLTPIRLVRRRPITRRSILIPIVASGFLLGGLVAGGGFALAELCARATRQPYYSGTTTSGQPAGYSTSHDPQEGVLWMVVAAAVAVWIAWSVVFGLLARQGDPTSVGMKLHRILIAGSVLELLVAVPAHIVVRRRSDCCAGILTGTGICVGIVIALVSFGPTVLLLYHKRCKQIEIPSHSV